MGHAIMFWDSVVLPSTDDPRIGEKVTFFEFFKTRFLTKLKHFQIDQNLESENINTLRRIFLVQNNVFLFSYSNEYFIGSVFKSILKLLDLVSGRVIIVIYWWLIRKRENMKIPKVSMDFFPVVTIFSIGLSNNGFL